MKIRTVGPVTGALLMFAIMGLACGCGGGGEEPTSRWLQLLGRVPDTSDTQRFVMINDYERAREIFGIPLPEPGADGETLTEYTEGLIKVEQGAYGGIYPLVSVFLRNYTGSDQWEEWRRELGFTIADVDQEIQASLPNEVYRVLRGRFVREAIDQAVRSDPLWSDLLEEVSHRGVDYYTWGEDHTINADRTSAVRRLGIGHRLALHGDYLYWAPWTDGVEGMIDAALNKRQSLADLEHYQLLADGLESLGTFTALFTEETQAASGFEYEGPPYGEARWDLLQQEPKLLPYEAFATGAGEDVNGPFTAVVVMHADEEIAGQNVQRLERRIAEAREWNRGRPWAELIPDFNILSDGPLVLAKLYSSEPDLWFQFVVLKNPLLLHE